MKTSAIRFEQLRRFLLDLGFTEERHEGARRFEHAATETIFLFRPYRLTDQVYEHDLVTVRSQLDWRGLMAADAFGESLAKTPA
jgi:hypothetical protein